MATVAMPSNARVEPQADAVKVTMLLLCVGLEYVAARLCRQ